MNKKPKLAISHEVPIGIVLGDIRVEQRLGTNANGQSVYLCMCITCGRKYMYTKDQILFTGVPSCLPCLVDTVQEEHISNTERRE